MDEISEVKPSAKQRNFLTTWISTSTNENDDYLLMI